MSLVDGGRIVMMERRRMAIDSRHGPAPAPGPSPVHAAQYTGLGRRQRRPPCARSPRTCRRRSVSPAIERFVRQSGRTRHRRAPLVVNRVPQPVSRQVPSALPPATPPPARPPAPAGSLLTMGPSPLPVDLKLKPAPFEETDLRFPINLATALRLSDARPLIVAAAQASVWVAEAELTRAKVLWVPSPLFGIDYIRHDGGGPDFNKGIMTAPSVNFFYAGPSLWQYVNLSDAIFEPLAARQVLNPALGRPVGEERRSPADRRRLLPGPPVPGNVRRRPLHRRAGTRPCRDGSRA